MWPAGRRWDARQLGPASFSTLRTYGAFLVNASVDGAGLVAPVPPPGGSRHTSLAALGHRAHTLAALHTQCARCPVTGTVFAMFACVCVCVRTRLSPGCVRCFCWRAKLGSKIALNALLAFVPLFVFVFVCAHKLAPFSVLQHPFVHVVAPR